MSSPDGDPSFISHEDLIQTSLTDGVDNDATPLHTQDVVNDNTSHNVPLDSRVPAPEILGHHLATPLRTPVQSSSSVERMSPNLDEIKKKYSISYSSIMLRLINYKFKVPNTPTFCRVNVENTFQFRVC